MALRFLNSGYFAGKVGIGIDNPTTSLHVDSVSAFPTLTLARSTTHSGISFTAGISNYTGAGADLLFDGVGSNTGFGFRTRNSSNTQVNALVIAPSGNVGIGVTAPSEKLEVNSGSIFVNGENNGIIVDSVSKRVGLMKYSGHEGVIARASTVDFGIIRCATSDIFDGSSLIYDLYVSGTGDVGIGTTSPGSKLHVNEADSSIGISARFKTAQNLNYILLQNSSAANHYIQTNSTGISLSADENGSGGSVSLKTNNDTALYVNASQNVGIGTTSPSEKLDVAGNIKITAALLSNQENIDVDSAAAEMVAQVSTTDYTAAFFDFVVKKGTNVRSGTVYACHDGTNVEFTETSTQDLGDTSDVVLSVDKTGNNLRLIATVTSDDWSVKSLIRAI